jgi:cell division protease FtsH
MAPALLSAPPALVRGSRRAARSATRCAAASAAAPAVVAPPALVVAAPASRGVSSAAPAGLAGASLAAPSPLWTLADAEAAVATATAPAEALPEASSWRYSEFIDAVTRGKVERVRFSKDGSSLQLTAVDGCAPRGVPGRWRERPFFCEPCGLALRHAVGSPRRAAPPS